MKKTKLLIVIALAVLATLAMSACGLIVNSVSDIEFVKMPKTYYSTTDIETNGITIKLNVTSSSTLIPEEIEWTIKEDSATKTVDGLTLTATGYKTTMGEWELVVKDANGTVEISAQYRVCKEIEDEATLRSSLLTVAEGEPDTGYFMLKKDIENDEGFFVVKRPFVLYGEGHSIIKTGYNNTDTTSEGYEKNNYDGTDARKYFEISSNYLPEKYKGGLFEFNNVTMYVADGVDMVNRGVNIYGLSGGATVNFNACGVADVDHYAINISSLNNGITVNISNGTWSAGWAAVQCHSSNAKVNIDSAELIGANGWSGERFGTIVLGSNCDNSVFNITNTKIVAAELAESVTQDHIEFQNTAENNVVNFVNCMYSTEVEGNRGVNYNALVNMSNILVYEGNDTAETLTKNIITIK